MFEFVKNWFREEPVPEAASPPILVRVTEPPQTAPVTYEEAVQAVACCLDEDSDHPYFHMFEGRTIRNGLGLWQKDTALYQHMLRRFGLGHADDTGMIITNAAQAFIEGREYSPDEDVARCKRHWIERGIDPATQERIT